MANGGYDFYSPSRISPTSADILSTITNFPYNLQDPETGESIFDEGAYRDQAQQYVSPYYYADVPPDLNPQPSQFPSILREFRNEQDDLRKLMDRSYGLQSSDLDKEVAIRRQQLGQQRRFDVSSARRAGRLSRRHLGGQFRLTRGQARRQHGVETKRAGEERVRSRDVFGQEYGAAERQRLADLGAGGQGQGGIAKRSALDSSIQRGQAVGDIRTTFKRAMTDAAMRRRNVVDSARQQMRQGRQQSRLQQRQAVRGAGLQYRQGMQDVGQYARSQAAQLQLGADRDVQSWQRDYSRGQRDIMQQFQRGQQDYLSLARNTALQNWLYKNKARS